MKVQVILQVTVGMSWDRFSRTKYHRPAKRCNFVWNFYCSFLSVTWGYIITLLYKELSSSNPTPNTRPPPPPPLVLAEPGSPNCCFCEHQVQYKARVYSLFTFIRKLLAKLKIEMASHQQHIRHISVLYSSYISSFWQLGNYCIALLHTQQR